MIKLMCLKRLVPEITADFLDDRPRTISLTWSINDPGEVEMAKKKFIEYLEKGWIAFKMAPDGKKIQIYKFDSSLGEIVLARLVEGG